MCSMLDHLSYHILKMSEITERPKCTQLLLCWSPYQAMIAVMNRMTYAREEGLLGFVITYHQ